ncbi:MAG: NAD(+) diphosphatase [Muribaculaceae bacterium]|nr:NAD(+) diphosphatase [Muribaculaceae bacterium]
MTKVIIDGEEREVGLREAWNYMTEEEWKQEARKAELDHFFSTHRFCGTCGAAMQPSTDISLKCPACGREDFPSLSPAILVLVKRGEEALLVHARSFTRPVYALVAGFVETGENLEECVRREIHEETSLEVSNIRYFGSQSWPFPSQLMIAFTADYAGGELRFADGELSAGGWFSRRNPPALPTLPSLSRQLIDAWISGKLS